VIASERRQVVLTVVDKITKWERWGKDIGHSCLRDKRL